MKYIMQALLLISDKQDRFLQVSLFQKSVSAEYLFLMQFLSFHYPFFWAAEPFIQIQINHILSAFHPHSGSFPSSSSKNNPKDPVF